MDYSSERNTDCRIFEFYHRELRMVSLENNCIKLSILLDKGADFTEILYKPKDINFMWKAPGWIRQTSKFISSNASVSGNFMDYYEGGWQEILPGGGPFNYLGAEMGHHGEACLLPWDFTVEKDEPEEICIRLLCKTIRFPFKIKKNIKIQKESNLIEISETLINESPDDLEFMWGQHPAFGEPFLEEGCVINTTAKNFIATGKKLFPKSCFSKDFSGSWPLTKTDNGTQINLSVIPSKAADISDLFYLSGLDEGWYAITNPRIKVGLGFIWDLKMFPYLWFWKVCKGSIGYPLFNRTYNIALEPWTGFPDNFEAARKNKTIKKIKGYEEISTTYKIVVYTGLEKVKRIDKKGIVI
jgi:galactose mutarotase-like enzyme